MGLGDWIKRKAVQHEGEALVKENPTMKTWLLTHKTLCGGVAITLSAVMGLVQQMYPDSKINLGIAMASLFIGAVLQSAGVVPSDQEHRAKLLQDQLAPAAHAVADAAPAILTAAQALAEVLKPHLDQQTQAIKDLHETIANAADPGK